MLMGKTTLDGNPLRVFLDNPINISTILIDQYLRLPIDCHGDDLSCQTAESRINANDAVAATQQVDGKIYGKRHYLHQVTQVNGRNAAE